MPSKKTKKKLRETAKNQQHAKVEEKVVTPVDTKEQPKTIVEQPTETPKFEEQKQTVKSKNKDKKTSKVKTKGKELVSELKKVTWPTAGKVAKKTGVVLVVVAVFAVVLLGIHELLQLVYTAFIENVK